MPYSGKQCRYFRVAEKQGKSVPKDYKGYCAKTKAKNTRKRRSKRPTNGRRGRKR